MREEDLVPLAQQVVHALRAVGYTIAVAESCTGGLVSHLLTCVPGSSEVMLLGAVTYSNDMKTGLLAVGEGQLRRYGAVSQEVAASMAEGARDVAGSDLGIAVTGIAGPGGGSPDKPVGTVCFGLATAMETETQRQLFAGSRIEVKLKSAQQVLEWIRRHCERKIR